MVMIIPFECDNTGQIKFHNPNGTNACQLSNRGDIVCYLESISTTGTDYVVVYNADVIGTWNFRTSRVAFDTCTGFHRCYVDDELCNDENIDIFQNIHVGRIVIFTGKIKTDLKKQSILKRKKSQLMNMNGIQQ